MIGKGMVPAVFAALLAVGCGAKTGAAAPTTVLTAPAGLLEGFHQLGVQALGLGSVGAFTFTASFLVLWLMKRTFGIRTEAEVETMGKPWRAARTVANGDEEDVVRQAAAAHALRLRRLHGTIR